MVFPGQILKISGTLERMSGQRIALAPYVMDARTKEIHQQAFDFPLSGDSFEYEWTLPELPFAIGEVGILATNFDSEKFLGYVRISNFSITGKHSFSVNMAEEELEFGGLSRCSLVGGAWTLEDEALHVVTADDFQLCSGPYYSKDSRVSAELIPDNGDSHLLSFRSRGAEYGYFFGLHGENQVAFLQKDGSVEILADTDFNWKHGDSYKLEVTVKTESGACRMTGSVNGVEILNILDKDPHPYGMAGLGKLAPGRTHFVSLSAQEL